MGVIAVYWIMIIDDNLQWLSFGFLLRCNKSWDCMPTAYSIKAVWFTQTAYFYMWIVIEWWKLCDSRNTCRCGKHYSFIGNIVILTSLTVCWTKNSKNPNIVEIKRFSYNQSVSKLRHLKTAIYTAFSSVMIHNSSMCIVICITVWWTYCTRGYSITVWQLNMIQSNERVMFGCRTLLAGWQSFCVHLHISVWQERTEMYEIYI